MYKFEKLVVWHKSIALLDAIYDICHYLPISEERNIMDQLKRSALSISLNIAEGSGSENDKEFRRFLNIAKKSLFEVVAILKITNHLYQIKIDTALDLTDEVSKLIHGLTRKLGSINSSNS